MVVTIPNGIDGDRISRVARTTARDALGLRDEFLFVSLSRHTLQKNTYALADAFLEMAPSRRTAHLLICGRVEDPEYARQVVSLRQRSASANRLHLRHNTDRIDVVLAAADAFVLDSYFEGWSLASMEALGAGVPVLLSDVGGAREQLTGGPAKGLLVSNPLGDPLSVNWESMSSTRYARQTNRGELVSGLTSFVDCMVDHADSRSIAEDARERFSDEHCVQRHATVIRRAAERMPVGGHQHTARSSTRA
jgi:glycosyltransferase involved in cell wall biosynthesis